MNSDAIIVTSVKKGLDNRKKLFQVKFKLLQSLLFSVLVHDCMEILNNTNILHIKVLQTTNNWCKNKNII